jgi:ribosomal protein L11 methyltransferase
LFSILLHPSPDREDFLVAELYECGTAGIAEEDGGIRAFFDDASDTAVLLRRFAEFAPTLRSEPSTDWAQVSRDAWPPLLVGKRFFLVPPWRAEDPTPPGRLRLEVHPGMACGTGRHPCTQLSLEAIERYVQPGHRVLDIGAGSGILSAAAALLGAGCVIGCDVDADTVRIARERVHTPMFIGSVDAVRSQWADVIVANIDAATLEHLAQELTRVRKPDSTLILSGFPHWDVPEGFTARETLRREEWLCLIC